jgi:hypothetical protein
MLGPTAKSPTGCRRQFSRGVYRDSRKAWGWSVADDGAEGGSSARERPWWRSPYALYFIFVHTPLSITAICVAAVFEHGLVPWAGVALGVGAIFLMIPAGWLGARWGKQSRLEEEAIAMVPRPRKCDRCHEIEPSRCPRPWLGTCPLRSSKRARLTRTSSRSHDGEHGRRCPGARQAA